MGSAENATPVPPPVHPESPSVPRTGRMAFHSTPMARRSTRLTVRYRAMRTFGGVDSCRLLTRKLTPEVPVQNSCTQSRIRSPRSPRASLLFDTLQQCWAAAKCHDVIMLTPLGRLPRRRCFLIMTPSIVVGNRLPIYNVHGDR